MPLALFLPNLAGCPSYGRTDAQGAPAGGVATKLLLVMGCSSGERDSVLLQLRPAGTTCGGHSPLE